MTTQELISKAHNIAADDYVKNGKSRITSAYNNNELRSLVGGQFANNYLSKLIVTAYNEAITELIIN